MNRDPDSVLDAISSIVMRFAKDGSVVYMNRYAEQFFGVERNCCTGLSLQDCLRERNPAAGEKIESMIRHCIRDPDTFKTACFEIPRTPDSSVLISWSNQPLTSSSGEIEEIVTVGHEPAGQGELAYKLRDMNDRFKVMLENIQTGVLIIDPREMIILYLNRRASDILGLPREMIAGEPCSKFCHSGDGLCFPVPSGSENETTHNIETSFVRTDGRKIHILKSSAVVFFRGERFILESFIDISGKKQMEERLHSATRQIENLLSSIVSVLIGVSIDDYITHWNKAAEEIFGISAADVLNRPFPSCGLDWEWNRIFEGIANSIMKDEVTYLQNISFLNQRGNQGYLDITVNSIVDRSGGITGFLLFGEDVTEKEQNIKLLEEIEHRKKIEYELKRLNAELDRLAKEDVLTGLSTRRFFMEQFESEFRRARRYGTEFALLMIDVDHFKDVNDTHGHLLGDKVLHEIGKTIKAVTRSSDISGRYGGEEFCILLPLSGTDSAVSTAEKLCRAVETSRFEGKNTFSVTCSIGVTSIRKEDSDLSGILRRADEALYKAKEAGRNMIVAG